MMLADFARGNEAAESGAHKPDGLQEQLLPLLLEERRLLQLHGAKHPEVLAIREKIETAQRTLLLPANALKIGSAAGDDPVRAHVDFLRQKLLQLKISEELLTEFLQKEEGEARRLANYEIQ